MDKDDITQAAHLSTSPVNPISRTDSYSRTKSVAAIVVVALAIITAVAVTLAVVFSVGPYALAALVVIGCGRYFVSKGSTQGR